MRTNLSELDAAAALCAVERDFLSEQSAPDDENERREILLRVFRSSLPTLRSRALKANTRPDDYWREYLNAGWNTIVELYAGLHSNCYIDNPPNEKPRGFWQHQEFDAFRTHDATRGFRISKDELVSAATQYVSQPQIYTNALDWIFLDALVFMELEAFTETVASTNSSMGLNWARLFAGRSRGRYWVLKFGFGLLGLAVRVIWGPALAWYLAANGYNVAALIVLALWAYGWVWRFVTYPTRRRLWRKNGTLIERLLQLYQLLGDSTISPRRLREALDAATKEGVVLDGPVFAIVDRIVATGATAFLPHQS